ncbi:unnamed protein product, partial [Heterosigma akashiwo]
AAGGGAGPAAAAGLLPPGARLPRRRAQPRPAGGTGGLCQLWADLPAQAHLCPVLPH